MSREYRGGVNPLLCVWLYDGMHPPETPKDVFLLISLVWSDALVATFNGHQDVAKLLVNRAGRV